MMFRGVNAVNLDSKGRMILPSRHRTLLAQAAQQQLIITIDAEGKCLLLYPLPAWEEIEKKIEELPSFNQTARRIQRLLIGHATELEIDNNGRLLLPSLLREYTLIDRQVILAGQGKKIEVWSKDIWEKEREKWLNQDLEKDTETMPAALQLLSL